jgi:pantoate--beta-alanine ligase
MKDPMVIDDPRRIREACDAARTRGLVVGFVPTMGALHEGHLALVREARARAGFVVCSIFVNPTQFGPTEDFTRYPRDLAGDVAKLEGVDLVFAPTPSRMYVSGESTRVRVEGLTAHLCGPYRPGHFEGVATVVAKLFSIVGPSVSVFGKKDYQQLAVIRRMVADLFFPIEVAGHPIVREPDGLAMSSRNAYLSPDERSRALALSRGLAAAARAFAAGERSAGVLRRLAEDSVRTAATSIDYVTLADASELVPFDDGGRVPDRALLAIACRIGSTRLIDNVVLGEDPPPGALA